MSLRGDDWLEFSRQVKRHIENYTVPQYGDKGMDICTHYTAEECLTQAKKYIERYGRNSREGQQELDFLKMAHFIQMAYEKHMRGTKETLDGTEISKHDERIDEIRDIHKTTENNPVFVSAGRVESGNPMAYRLYKDPWGNLHLQGCYQWSEGIRGGFEWRTIETVTNPD